MPSFAKLPFSAGTGFVDSDVGNNNHIKSLRIVAPVH